MKISNFRYIETKGDSILNFEYFAEIDVTTNGILWWKKTTENKKIRRTPAGYWHFVDTGEFCPGLRVENLARAFTAQTGIEV